MSGVLTVPAGTTLTVEPGAIVKLTGGVFGFIDVRGRLDVQGGAIFTSIKDDTAGGDTNGDNPEQLPARGDWGGIIFKNGSSASLVTGAEVRFAFVGMSFETASPTIQGATIVESGFAAMDLNSNSFPSVTGSSFQMNNFAVTGVPLGAVPGFVGNGAMMNDLGHYLHITDDTFAGNVAIGPLNALGGEPFPSPRSEPCRASRTTARASTCSATPSGSPTAR